MLTWIAECLPLRVLAQRQSRRVDAASDRALRERRSPGGGTRDEGPISGAFIQIYAVGTGGDGSQATPLLSNPVIQDLAASSRYRKPFIVQRRNACLLCRDKYVPQNVRDLSKQESCIAGALWSV